MSRKNAYTALWSILCCSSVAMRLKSASVVPLFLIKPCKHQLVCSKVMSLHPCSQARLPKTPYMVSTQFQLINISTLCHVESASTFNSLSTLLIMPCHFFHHVEIFFSTQVVNLPKGNTDNVSLTFMMSWLSHRSKYATYSVTTAVMLSLSPEHPWQQLVRETRKKIETFTQSVQFSTTLTGDVHAQPEETHKECNVKESLLQLRAQQTYEALKATISCSARRTTRNYYQGQQPKVDPYKHIPCARLRRQHASNHEGLTITWIQGHCTHCGRMQWPST